MLFQKSRTVTLAETDATQTVYFTNFFKYSVETFEAFIFARFDKPASLPVEFPIVDAHASFLSPLRLFDEITVTLMEIQPNNTSLRTISQIHKEDKCVSKIELIHVAIDPITKEKLTLDNLSFGFLPSKIRPSH